MNKQIGYGELVFKKTMEVKLKDGSTESREHVQKRHYKVKKREGKCAIHRININQLASLKATPGVICMQQDVVNYFTAYRQTLTKQMINRMNANKPKEIIKKKSWFEKLLEFFKSLFRKKQVPALDEVADRLKV